MTPKTHQRSGARLPRAIALPLAIALAAPLSLLGCGETLDTADEALEIATDGGVQHLREPLRPAAGPPRVLIFALDGVGHDVLNEALEQGDLPTLAALLGEGSGSGTYAHGASAGPVLTVLPSITLAAWTTLFTGSPPGETGVPGNEWFDRASGRFYAPAPVSVTGRNDALATLSDQLLDSLIAVPTLFERADVRSYVSLLPIHRGADLLALPGGGELAELFGAFPAGAVGDEPVNRELYSAVDRASANRMSDLVDDEGPADLAVVYFPGIDLFTHATPSPLEEQRRYLAEVTDSAMATVLSAYRRAGALDGTYVIVTSDHGHTPVLNDHVHALGGDSAFSAATALEEAGFRVRPFDLDEGTDDHQAVMAWQGAFAYVSIADRSTCAAEGAPCVWTRAPRWDDDVIPAARALARAAARHPSDPLDLVILRRGNEQGTSDLFVLAGSGPDGPGQQGDPGDLAEPVPLADHLAANPRPELLAFAERLRWLTSGPEADHAGDVILMTRLGASTPTSERFYFSKPYHSWHASAEEQDSHAPLIVARTDMSGEELAGKVGAEWSAEPTQLDFLELVLRLLEAPADTAAQADTTQQR